MNQQMWDRVAQFMASQTPKTGPIGAEASNPSGLNPVIWAQKMTKDNNPETFINTFERTAAVADWPETQWSAILIPSPMTHLYQAIWRWRKHWTGSYNYFTGQA